jgi:hypothetical protein
LSGTPVAKLTFLKNPDGATGFSESHKPNEENNKKIHPAENSPVADLVTYWALPTRSISYMDPFLSFSIIMGRRYN